jgi:5-formyltetrahydrofolate cyclo-ligase
VKKERRQYYRQIQSSFTEQQYRAWNHALAKPLKEAIHQIPKHSVVAVYQAQAKEADLSSLFSLPYRFCFPKVLSRNGKMEFRLVEKVHPAEFHEGHFGILEPTEKHPLVHKDEIAACFVPLLSFDDTGRRLGKGKGFYDRFLEGFEGKKIGVGFEWQYSPTPLPIEEYDQHLHLVVTEHGIRQF